MAYFKNEMYRDRKKVKQALKVLEHGSSNKFKYVDAKDLICHVARVYISEGLKRIEEIKEMA